MIEVLCASKKPDYLVFSHSGVFEALHLDTGDIQTIGSFDEVAQRRFPLLLERPAWVNDLTYFNGALWVAGAHTGVYNITDGQHVKRDTSSHTLLDHNGALIDAGYYGIHETLTDKVLLSRSTMSAEGIYAIDHLFHRNDVLYGVGELTCRGHAVYRIEPWQSPSVVRQGPRVRTTLKHGKVVPVGNKTITNLFDNRRNPLSSDALIYDGSHFIVDGAVIRDVLYDSARGVVYISLDNTWTTAKEKYAAIYSIRLDSAPWARSTAPSMALRIDQNLVTRRNTQILALTLLTSQELETCTRKTKKHLEAA